MSNALPVQSMKIEEITYSEKLVRVFAVCGGKRYEFTSFRSGPVEVYDFPRSWRGVSRQVGYLSADTAAKLRTVLQRDEHHAALKAAVAGRWNGATLASPSDVLANFGTRPRPA